MQTLHMSGQTHLILFLTLPYPEAEYNTPSKRRKSVSDSLSDDDCYRSPTDNWVLYLGSGQPKQDAQRMIETNVQNSSLQTKSYSNDYQRDLNNIILDPLLVKWELTKETTQNVLPAKELTWCTRHNNSSALGRPSAGQETCGILSNSNSPYSVLNRLSSGLIRYQMYTLCTVFEIHFNAALHSVSAGLHGVVCYPHFYRLKSCLYFSSSYRVKLSP
jgi:hypothetical protein